jgi:ATP-dependent Clp protease ATP-binding subunit ClpB
MSEEPAGKQLLQLDLGRKASQIRSFEDQLRARIVGQERAVNAVISLYEIFKSGLNNPFGPIGTMLFLGPTGSGKTRVVEAAAESLFGDRNAVIKIDCAEFQHSHEISKLIGSPPGYIGHRETQPILTQENIERFHTEQNPFSLVLFDEIEKASDALWQLLLGIMETATLTLGDTRRVDFTRTVIFLTSNLGTREINRLLKGSIGFTPAQAVNLAGEDVSQRVHHTAVEAAKRRFSPEFMNRIDQLVVFHSLKEEHLRQILELELLAVQNRVDKGRGSQFKFRLTDAAKQFLLDDGTDLQYGARHLKRAIDRFLLKPFANLLLTEQLRTGDVIVIDIGAEDGGIVVSREDERVIRAGSTG